MILANDPRSADFGPSRRDLHVRFVCYKGEGSFRSPSGLYPSTGSDRGETRVIVPSPFRVVLLEDDRFAQEVIRRELVKGAPDLLFRCVDTAEAFEAAVGDPGLHVILSDFILPSFDALAALRVARRLQPRVPFIVVTGSIDEETA